jgi:hypothetical protein
VGTVVAAANRHDSPLLRPALERLGRFGFRLSSVITVHLDAGYDSAKTRGLLDEVGCEAEVATKGRPAPIQVGKHCVVERSNSWHNRGFKKLAICTERRIRVIDAFVALANAIITVRRLIREAWTTQRWDTRPTRRP